MATCVDGRTTNTKTVNSAATMHNQKLIIYGNGHMARLFYHFARPEFDVVAFTVDRAVLAQPLIENIPVVAFDEIEHHYDPNDHFMVTAVGYLQMN